MNVNGKILFFSSSDGTGIIITESKDKIKFNIQEWDDFDTMPAMGLQVSFVYENKIASIITVNNNPEIKQEKQEYIYEEIPEKNTHSYTNPVIDKQNLDTQLALEKEVGLVDNIQSIKQELGNIQESINVTLNLSDSVTKYFKAMENNIAKRKEYKNSQERLNYIVIRRFIWTTFNNLNELDMRIITPEIRTISNDLREMAKIYNDFERKIKYPSLAYEEIFLLSQAEYTLLRKHTETISNKIQQLQISQEYLESSLEHKKTALKDNKNKEDIQTLNQEYKLINGTYVDIIHIIAELEERYKQNKELLLNFEEKFMQDFHDSFIKVAAKYKNDLIHILDAQAFKLDILLWKQAKTSKSVIDYFHKANITGQFNTKTYLKYYLDTQDMQLASDEHKKLIEVYKYLESLHMEYIIVLTDSSQDAMDFQEEIQKINQKNTVKSFINEKLALKWALNNTVKVLVVNESLAHMNMHIFLNYYKKYIITIPKIIILGNTKQNAIRTTTKLLSENSSPHLVAKHVKELLTEKEIKN